MISPIRLIYHGHSSGQFSCGHICSSFGHRFSHKSRVRSNSSVLPLPKISALGELQLDGETCRSAFVPRTEVLEPQLQAVSVWVHRVAGAASTSHVPSKSRALTNWAPNQAA